MEISKPKSSKPKGLQKQAEALMPVVLKIVNEHIGQENAIKAKEIRLRLGMKNDRSIREAIRLLRKRGYLILSSVKPPRGYYMAATLGEWIEFRDGNLKTRALDILQTSRAMGLAAMRRFSSQMALSKPFEQN